jgi:hypothetical protein
VAIKACKRLKNDAINGSNYSHRHFCRSHATTNAILPAKKIMQITFFLTSIPIIIDIDVIDGFGR